MSTSIQNINLGQIIVEIKKITGSSARSIDVPDNDRPFCKVYEYYDANGECHYSTIVRYSPKGVDIVKYTTPFSDIAISHDVTPHVQRMHLSHEEIEEIFLTDLTKAYLKQEA